MGFLFSLFNLDFNCHGLFAGCKILAFSFGHDIDFIFIGAFLQAFFDGDFVVLTMSRTIVIFRGYASM